LGDLEGGCELERVIEVIPGQILELPDADDRSL